MDAALEGDSSGGVGGGSSGNGGFRRSSRFASARAGRGGTSTFSSRGGELELDESLHLERFGENTHVDDIDMQTVRSGPGMFQSQSQSQQQQQQHQHGRSLVDIFLADDDKNEGDNNVVEMVATNKSKKCRNVLLWVGVLVVIGIIFVTVPKGGLGSSSRDEPETVESSGNDGDTDTDTANVTITTSSATSSPQQDQKGENSTNTNTHSTLNDIQKQTPAPGVHHPNGDVDKGDNTEKNRFQAVHEFVVNQQVSLEEAFDDPQSPASLALDWISRVDQANLNIPGYQGNVQHSSPALLNDNDNANENDNDDNSIMGRLLLQRYTLAVLYYSMANTTTTTEENEGRQRQRQLFDAPATQDELDFRYQFDHWLMEGEDTCDWYGVRCNANQDIVTLNLTKCLLQGELPRELLQPQALPALTVLDVSHNRLTGLEETEAIRLPNLQQVHIQHNPLWQSGLAPFLEVSTLSVLDLSTTQPNEPLPDDWSFLSNLESISMSDCNLHGSLPANWGSSLTKLHTINLNGNELSGTIPAEWSSLTLLEYFQLGHNPIRGTIPDFIGTNMPHLKHISLQDTNLDGVLPSSSLAKLQELQELHLHRTYVRGTMPEAFCALVDSAILRVLTSDCDDSDPHTDARMVCSCCTRCYPHHSRN